MKKNRNNFFTENNSFNQVPNQGFNPAYQNNMPIPQYQMNANSSFYAGNMPYNNINNDIEARLAKIERQISRLDKRISNIENNTIKTTDDFESTTNNMYII